MRKMLSYSILDLGKCPNLKTHGSESACFPVGSKMETKSNFLIKYYLITILNFCWSVSAYTYQSQKMDFLLYFQIMRGRVRDFFSS